MQKVHILIERSKTRSIQKDTGVNIFHSSEKQEPEKTKMFMRQGILPSCDAEALGMFRQEATLCWDRRILCKSLTSPFPLDLRTVACCAKRDTRGSPAGNQLPVCWFLPFICDQTNTGLKRSGPSWDE